VIHSEPAPLGRPPLLDLDACSVFVGGGQRRAVNQGLRGTAGQVSRLRVLLVNFLWSSC